MPELHITSEHIDALATTADSAGRIRLYKEVLEEARQQQRRQFEQGLDAASLTRLRADSIDSVLKHAWQNLVTQQQTDDVPALVAVGGYGRAELHPGSDIDIMLLLPGDDDVPWRERLTAFLTLLWDIGLDVGQSVRSLRDCIEQAEADITVATNLMEARLLSGSQELFDHMRTAVDAEHIWPSRDFFAAKWQEQIARHNRFNDTAYNLEPNIKEGPGGLRDIQMIGWVAKRHFGAETLRDLIRHDFLTEEEYQLLTHHQEFLWRIRFALHFLTNRREDRLLFDYQREIAEQFGFTDEKHQLGVEKFMKQYYRSVSELSRLNEMLLQLFQEAILYADEPGEPTVINKRFQSRKGFIEVVNENVFKRYPFALLEIFLLLEQHPELKGVRAETIRLIRAHHYLIDDDFRNDLRCRSLFMEIIRQPQGVTHELRRMHKYGILGAYLPVFARIIGQMQYDLFHVYTVDEHTLFVVRNLRRMTVPEFSHELPHCSEIIRRIPKPELLYIAGLFHDIAKGRGGDHSELGARDAIDFCHQHGLSEYDTNIVAWLVNQHLLMSRVSQREDISDPEIINRFADTVGNRDRLDYLYLLTVADMRATSPDVWNSWKGSLLRELYDNTRKALRKRLASIDDEEVARDIRQQALARIKDAVDAAELNALWDELSDDYFLRYSVNEIVNHALAILHEDSHNLPLILIHDAIDYGGSEIFIYTITRKGLFAAITSVLDQLGLSIVDARIIRSSKNHSFDSYIVLEQDGTRITPGRRTEEIYQTLRDALTRDIIGGFEVTRRLPRQHKHFDVETQVNFDTDTRNMHTVMEVITADRPGLLAAVGEVLQRNNIRLHTARITTFGLRAEDLFYITDDNDNPLSNAQQKDLAEAVIKQLND
ncbi:[protein-PII] uridylyltransferase [Sulfuriflexus sp.]|uniref:[protein-PII] uridylyltransferase n=1 Tax=Sulfuriflexus sp. TaxID=2015443 RepID=UPI0028CEFCC7|nr:[protein-PII] uridylyltransferase [Sulfuriflexus sp.]MDT8402988.1 [protein-PII] uridylyltransferase [Sulfuriflexus sp.]